MCDTSQHIAVRMRTIHYRPFPRLRILNLKRNLIVIRLFPVTARCTYTTLTFVAYKATLCTPCTYSILNVRFKVVHGELL